MRLAVEDWGLRPKSVLRSNYTNGVVRSRGVGYEKCREKESECFGDEVFEMFFFGVSRMDRVRNEEVLGGAGIERELASREDQRVLRFFGACGNNG